MSAAKSAEFCDLMECGVWDQHEGLIYAYFMYDPTLKLFTTNDAVLVYDDEQGLVIRSLV